MFFLDAISTHCVINNDPLFLFFFFNAKLNFFGVIRSGIDFFFPWLKAVYLTKILNFIVCNSCKLNEFIVY